MLDTGPAWIYQMAGLSDSHSRQLRFCAAVTSSSQRRQTHRPSARCGRGRVKYSLAYVDAHRWLDKLLSDPTTSIAALADRERKSERSIRMTLSLAFLAPNLAKAAVHGMLPRGFNTTRLVDLPMLWPEQWLALGLERPTDDPRYQISSAARPTPFFNAIWRRRAGKLF